MTNWKELSGDKNWEGQLQPLKQNLCKTLVHYGKRVQAIYESLDDGNPKYERDELFSQVTLGGLYTVNNYFYATSKIDFLPKGGGAWSGRAWIGYMVVATDEGKKEIGRRDILICWKGTMTPAEWIKVSSSINPQLPPFWEKTALEILAYTRDFSPYTCQIKES